jgi:D-alanine-D-alanine ligase
VLDQLPVPPCPLEWPVIVKPAAQDASVGVDQGSVVTDQMKLQLRVRRVLEAYGPPVLIEQFIPGRELTVGVVETPELRVLPVSEITFSSTKPGIWPIVTYDAKWSPGTDDYETTPPHYPAAVTPKMGERIQKLARDAYLLLGCRDYARVDFRVRPTGKPYILEVNPNPCLGPEAGLAGSLVIAGLSHAQFTVQLVRNALQRGSGAALPGVPGKDREAPKRAARREPRTPDPVSL